MTAAQTISITKDDLLEPTDPRLEANLALMVARSLPSDYVNDELINLTSGIGMSPEFHKMVAEVANGKMLVRDLAVYCYMAGRLSIALAAQP